MDREIRKDIENITEYTLPEHMGDIKKIIMSKARVAPSESYLGEGTLGVSGEVVYDCYYTSDDGNLASFCAPSPYNESVDVGECVGATVDSRVGNFGVRMLGPRRVELRAQIVCEVSVNSQDNLEIESDGCDGEYELQREVCECVTHMLSDNMNEEREYTSELDHIEGLTTDRLEVISSGGTVRISGADVKDSGIELHGELRLFAIVRGEDEAPFVIERTTPFSEFISAQTEGYDGVSANATLLKQSVSLDNDENGCSVATTARVLFFATMHANVTQTVSTDAYIQQRDTHVNYDDSTLTSYVCSGVRQESLGFEVSGGELGLNMASDVLLLTAEPASLNIREESGAIVCQGNLNFSGISCEVSNDGALNYANVKFTLPFSKNVNVGCQIPSKSVIKCRPVCHNCSAKISQDGAYIDVSVDFAYTVLNQKTVRRVRSVSVVGDKVYTRRPSCISVYYASEADTPFSVAKEFHTTKEAILADNQAVCAQAASSDGVSFRFSGKEKLIIKH